MFTLKQFKKTKMYKEMLRDVRALSQDPTALPDIRMYLPSFTKEEKDAAAVEMGFKDWADAIKKPKV